MNPQDTLKSRRAVAGRRRLLLAGLATLLLPALGQAQSKPVQGPLVEIWKSPTCGCCKDWVSHLEEHGFRTRIYDTGNTAMRARLGIPAELGGCHTALVAGYAIEGHVPAADIQRLLKSKPRAIGLAVPGMPIGSPGMDGPDYGGRHDAYDVLLLADNGQTSVFQAHH